MIAPYNPPQNFVSERMNHTIADFPNGFWAKALVTTIHLSNRSPSKVLDTKVPEEIWSQKPPSYKHLRVFGCEAYCHIPKEYSDKWAPKLKKCIFLGNGAFGKMGYHLWDPEARKMVHNNEVYFNEEKMHKRPIPIVEI